MAAARAAAGGEATTALSRLAACLAAKFERRRMRLHFGGDVFGDSWLSPGAAALVPALLPLVHDGSAIRVLALLFAADTSGEAMESAVRASPDVLPALVAVLAADDGAGGGVWAVAVEEALLLAAAYRMGMASRMMATPGLLPALIRRMPSFAALGSRAPLPLLAIIKAEPAVLPEAEAHGLLPQSVDLLARLLAAGRRTKLADAKFMLIFLDNALRSAEPPPGLARRLAAAGGITVIVAALTHPDAGSAEEAPSTMVRSALHLLCGLLEDSPARLDWFSCAGGFVPLVRLLGHPSDAVAAMAAYAVARFAELLEDLSEEDSDASEPPACVGRLLDAGAVMALRAALRRALEAREAGELTVDAAGLASESACALFILIREWGGRLRPRVVAEFGPLEVLAAWLAPRPPLKAVLAAVDTLCCVLDHADNEQREAMSAECGLVARALRLLTSRRQEFDGGGDGGGDGGACEHASGTCTACAQERDEMHHRIVLGCVQILYGALCLGRQGAAYILRACGGALRRLVSRGATQDIKDSASLLLSVVEGTGNR
jgi:hypothetical protein